MPHSQSVAYFVYKPLYPTMKRPEPFRFMLMLAMFGSGLFFVFCLLIYVLRKEGSNLVEIPLPRIFWVSTAVMLLSSLTLHTAQWAFRKDKYLIYRMLMGNTLLLGILFILMQLMGWQSIINYPQVPEARTSVGFIYLISGMHILHILVGLFFLIKIFIEALKRLSYVDSFVYSVNPPNQLKINLIVFYWHFVDVLWIVLFLFLVYQHQ